MQSVQSKLIFCGETEVYLVISYVNILHIYIIYTDRLCSLLVRVLGYVPKDPVSIPCTTRFSEQ
jgi:hypothetical protein